MAPTSLAAPRRALHPLHAVLLAGSLALFLGATLADLAYFRSYELQWSAFAAWLVLGGLVLALPAAVFAAWRLARMRGRERRGVVDAVLAVLLVVIGGWDALHHARDAWAVMPGGLVLSLLATVLAAAATVLAFAGDRPGGAR